jgi:hypothetical protein
VSDNPGIPGHDHAGWQLLAGRGSRGTQGIAGPRGLRGSKGAKAEAAPRVTDWHVEREHYRAFPVLSDGTLGPELDLRGFFEQFCLETAE